MYYHPHFTREETKAPKSYITNVTNHTARKAGQELQQTHFLFLLPTGPLSLSALKYLYM